MSLHTTTPSSVILHGERSLQHSFGSTAPGVRRFAAIVTASALLATASAHSLAADVEAQLVIRNKRFEPAELKVPAGQRVKLTVHNQDSTAEEFESPALKREKVVPAGAKAVLFVGPLKPGRYAFVGEYNAATAKGEIVAE